MSVCVPSVVKLTTSEAVPAERTAVPSVMPPSLNCTVPPGTPPELTGLTVATSVTGCSNPTVDGVATRLVVVAGAVTVIDTVATFESAVPSLALNVKLSGPM